VGYPSRPYDRSAIIKPTTSTPPLSCPMSTSVKATLHETIDRLSEADCHRLWQLWETQTIVIRPTQAIHFQPVSAIVIQGPTAAQSLIEDRR
jgi:hypothetical protein